jgi:hypothetical protein
MRMYANNYVGYSNKQLLYLATRSLLYCRVIAVDLLQNVIPFICELMANQLGLIGIWIYDIHVCLNI